MTELFTAKDAREMARANDKILNTLGLILNGIKGFAERGYNSYDWWVEDSEAFEIESKLLALGFDIFYLSNELDIGMKHITISW